MRWFRRIVLAVLLCTQWAQAQEDWGDKQLEEARKRLSELGEGEEAAPWRKAVQQRIALLDRLVKTRGQRAGLLDPAVIQQRRETAIAELAVVRQEAVLGPPMVRTAEQLAEYERAAGLADAARKDRQSALEAYQGYRKDAEAELPKLAQEEVEAKRLLESAQEEAEAALGAYLADNARIQLRLVAERREYLQVALERWAQRIPMQQAELDLATARYEDAQRRLDAARQSYAKVREEEAAQEREKAQAAERRAARAQDPSERFRYARRAEYWRARADTTVLTGKAETLKRLIDAEKETLARMRAERERIATRLRLRGEGAARLLRSLLDRTRSDRLLIERRRLPELQEEVTATANALVDALDRLYALQVPEEEHEQWQALAAKVGQEQASALFAEVVRGSDGLLAALRDLKDKLELVESRQRDLETIYVERLQELEETLRFLVSRLYWVRSDAPLGGEVLKGAGGELRQLVDIYASRHLLTGVAASFSATPLVFGGSLAGILAIVLVLLLLRPKLGRLTGKAGETAEDAAPGWKPILRATLLGLTLAALFPLALLAAGLLWNLLELPPELDVPVSNLLMLVAGLWFLRRLSWQFLRGEEGIAVRYFRLPPGLARQFHVSFGIFAASATLFFAPSAVLADDPFGLQQIPRLLHTLFLAGVAAALILLLRRQGALMQAWTGGAGSLHRLWGIAGPLLFLGLALIVVMDLMGYVVGASMLMTNAVSTFLLMLLLAGVYALLRWLIGKVANQVHARTREEEGVRAAYEVSSTVVTQLTRVVWALVIVLAVVFLARFWAVGGFLSGFESVRITQIADGTYLTLWDVIIAILWIAAGHFLVHNLSGVFEFLVFPLIGETTTGSRFVLLAVSRYVILVIAYAAALLALRFSFASIGWLLAAASVGLGFGLQEIVANFVSGLILLFERPIRVGDVITVGETGGTVEKINIRATVVTNWDRQQIIVPNKNFITQNLTNWTHNDDIMRRKVVVGVAYGSDVEKVLRVLEEIVAQTPGVRVHPRPRIWFEDFGDSSLVFEIWFFAPVEEGRPIMTRLRASIHKRFLEEGIEIPFPQRDLHIRSAEAFDAWAGLLEGRRAPRGGEEDETPQATP